MSPQECRRAKGGRDIGEQLERVNLVIQNALANPWIAMFGLD